ncbi:MAG: polysaccharide deacetylase family protein [Candidatus Buchananbacteria bacterium]
MSVKSSFYPILLSIDLEYWFESPSIERYLSGQEKESLTLYCDQLLSLLSAKRATATFFVTGKVIKQEPELIKKLHLAGHEIAVHSFDHQPLWHKTAQQFTLDLKEMIAQIQFLTSTRPIGHRAANFSLDQQTNWALKILTANDIKYDSSIFPYHFSPWLFKAYQGSLYGLASKNFIPYRINLNYPNQVDKNSALLEFPTSIFHWSFFKLPLTGGIYIRLIPWTIFKFLLKTKLKKEVASIHFHPFDFLTNPPQLLMPQLKKFIKYYNTKNTWKKLNYLLDNYHCLSFKQYLHENTLD